MKGRASCVAWCAVGGASSKMKFIEKTMLVAKRCVQAVRQVITEAKRILSPVVSKPVVVITAVAAASHSAMAQTNTAAGVVSELSAGVGSGYDTFVNIGVVVIGVGFVAWAARKGLKLRS